MKYHKLYKTDFINKDKQPLYIFHRFIKDDDLNNYLSDLNSVIQREKRCKEFTYLPEAIMLSKKEKKDKFVSDFWIDIENDVYMSFNYNFMKDMKRMINLELN